MNKFDYCYHLSKMEVEAAEQLAAQIVIPEDKVCIALHEKNQAEVDLLCPPNSHGQNGSDIDTLKSTDDPRLRNLLASRLVKGDEPLHEGITDEVLADTCVPIDLDYSNIDRLSSSVEDLRSSVRIANAKIHADNAAALSAKSAEIVENPKSV